MEIIFYSKINKFISLKKKINRLNSKFKNKSKNLLHVPINILLFLKYILSILYGIYFIFTLNIDYLSNEKLLIQKNININ